jgi:hypothetical protein
VVGIVASELAFLPFIFSFFFARESERGEASYLVQTPGNGSSLSRVVEVRRFSSTKLATRLVPRTAVVVSEYPENTVCK